jgi:hypothetical protein
MFRKTYYSNSEINRTLESDLQWIEQTKAEFELSFYQTDLDGVLKKVEKTADSCGFELDFSDPEKNNSGNQIALFIGRRKAEKAT